MPEPNKASSGKSRNSRRARSREGGYRRMQGKLYARIQYADETGRTKEKLRRVESGKLSDVWKEVRKMRDELSQHGEETLNADKMSFVELAEKYKESKVFAAVIKDGGKVAGLKSFRPVLTYVKIAVNYFGKKPIRSIKPRDIERFRTDRLNTPVEIEMKKIVRETVEGKKRAKKTILRENELLIDNCLPLIANWQPYDEC
ncbi:MAG: hypothetical protein IPK98_15470 [Chloracidobacterium sp.]|nr:hypothetical protein [Chloracidobacterium sp.]